MFYRFSMRPVEPFCSLNQLEQKITNASFYDGRGCHQFIVVGILRHLWTIIYLWSPRVCMVLYSLFLDSLVFIMFFKWRPFVVMSLKGMMLFIITRYRLCLNLRVFFSFKLMWYLGFIVYLPYPNQHGDDKFIIETVTCINQVFHLVLTEQIIKINEI